ncbi:MAG: TULIP family P47-like protein [Pseudomonadota bacterium]
MTFHRQLSALNVNTFGWDLVSSIRIGPLNQAIITAGRSPKAFSGTVENITCVAGKFGDWQISDESDGDLMCMTLPLRDIEITTDGAAKTFDAGTADIDLRLSYIPHDAIGPNSQPARQMLLVVDAGANDAMAPVSVTNVELEGHSRIDDIIDVQAALEAWLQDNIAMFTHVLAAVSLYETVEKDGDYVWMKPTYLAYAFGRDAKNPSQSILSILSQTCERNADDLPNQTVVDAIPDGLEAGFLVSRSRFLRDVIKPAMPAAYPGLRESDLTVLPDDIGLTLEDTVQLKNVEYDGKTYDPELLRLDINLYDTFVHTTMETRTKVSWGVWGHCRVSGGYGFKLITKRDGSRSMKVVEERPPTESSWKEVEEGAKITRLILAIIAALAGIIIAICTWGFGVAAAAPLYFAMYGGMIGFSALLANEIFSGETSPPLDLLETQIDDTLQWCTGSVFTPSFMALHHALQIGGSTTDGARMQTRKTSATPLAAAFQDRFAPVMANRPDAQRHEDRMPHV